MKQYKLAKLLRKIGERTANNAVSNVSPPWGGFQPRVPAKLREKLDK